MHTLLAIVVGALYTAGLYLMLRRSLVGLIIGLALLGHAGDVIDQRIFQFTLLEIGTPTGAGRGERAPGRPPPCRATARRRRRPSCAGSSPRRAPPRRCSRASAPRSATSGRAST